MDNIQRITFCVFLFAAFIILNWTLFVGIHWILWFLYNDLFAFSICPIWNRWNVWLGPVRANAIPFFIDLFCLQDPHYRTDQVFYLSIIHPVGAIILFMVCKVKEAKERLASERSGPSPFFADPASTIRRRAPYEE